MTQAQSERVINGRGKKRGSIIYSTDRKDKVSKIFIIFPFCASMGSGMISIHEEWLEISEAGRKHLTSQFEIVF